MITSSPAPSCTTDGSGLSRDGTKADSFFRQMGLSSGATTNVTTGALQAMLFNHLGKDGWELVTVTAGAGRDIYWFKRPR